MMLWPSQGYLTKYNFGAQDDMIFIHEPEGQFTEVSELPHTGETNECIIREIKMILLGDLKLMFKYERIPPQPQQEVVQPNLRGEESKTNADMV